MLWNVASGEHLSGFPSYANSKFSLVRDWSNVLTQDTDSTIAIYSTQTGNRLVQMNNTGFINSLISPDVERIFSNNDSTVFVREAMTGKIVKTFSFPYGSHILILGLTPDGAVLVLTMYSVLCFFNSSTGAKILEAGSFYGREYLKFSTASPYMVGYGYDEGVAILFDISSISPIVHKLHPYTSEHSVSVRCLRGNKILIDITAVSHEYKLQITVFTSTGKKIAVYYPKAAQRTLQTLPPDIGSGIYLYEVRRGNKLYQSGTFLVKQDHH
jgi:WD40 repeat protein